MSTSQNILEQVRTLPEGSVFSPCQFPGSRNAVGHAFSRLTHRGELLRVERGRYVAPVSGRFGLRAPAPEKVVEALAAQSGEKVAPHGANAANSLGLTRQVPVREVFWTTGRTRTLKLGSSEVRLTHASPWLLAFGKSQAGAAIRALVWIGEAQVGPSLVALRKTLPESEWHTLTSPTVRENLPTWLAEAIEQAAGG